MRHRIRAIVWLLAAYVLGINGFGAYSLYSTYRLTSMPFDRAARKAPINAAQQLTTDAGVEA
jgi:two-component system phosphate regulon sensor histidine kinase PhoR